MNPKLFAFLLASTLVGVIAASATLFAGWGLIAALAVYTLAGSLSLLTMSVAAVTLDKERSPMPAERRLHA